MPARKKSTKRRKTVRISKEWRPHAKQTKMVELLINPNDRRTKEDKCREVGITYKTLWQWLKKQEFIEYMNSQISKYTDAELPEVWKALMMQCKRGNIEAMKLFFKMKELDPDIKLKRDQIELARQKANGNDENPDAPDDGFIDALNNDAPDIWGNEYSGERGDET